MGDPCFGRVELLTDSLLPADARIRAAIAVGSPGLYQCLRDTRPTDGDVTEPRRKLLRYLIRMCTRATPFGLFAGVGEARWGAATELAIESTAARTRTRPDMEWLSLRLRDLESRIEVRRKLRLLTNPAAFFYGGRVILSKQQLPDASDGVGVSVRATNVVRRALELALHPIEYAELVSSLAETSSSATPDKIEALLTQLWQSGLLLTELRPAPTAPDPILHLVRRLETVPEAADIHAEITELVVAAKAWDGLPEAERGGAFVELASAGGRPAQVSGATASEKPQAKIRVQVDMALGLRGALLLEDVGLEAARAAELLLRMTPSRAGLRYLAAYREDFLARYGLAREVALLELLDPECGLLYAMRRMDLSDDKRDPVVIDIATRALFERRQVVALDDATIRRLETYQLTAQTAPISLDINVVLAAPSRESLDRGDFQLIVGPVMGAQAAGRVLGRFADMLPGAGNELACILRAEQALTPHELWAELVDVPPDPRGTNVAIRPAVTAYEIPVGALPSVSRDHVIPLTELVVGVRDDRFYVRWPQRDVDVLVRTGHMLHPAKSAGVAQFLADVSRDGRAVFTGFQWGPAKGFPFLPRVQVGRIVLSLAQWRLAVSDARRALRAAESGPFAEAVAQWRLHWKVPRHVYLSDLDHRLLLDLEHPLHVEELRREILRLPADGHVELQEALPGIDDAWLQGEDGHYLCELAVSLVQDPGKIGDRAALVPAPHRAPEPLTAPVVRRPPGSEWLFLKLYTAKFLEEELIADPVRRFAQHVVERGLADQWFFIRYADPELHVRLRFRGDPQKMLAELVPTAFAWLGTLMDQRLCSRFAVDTYDREVERYGGLDGMRIAESIFAVEQRCGLRTASTVGARALALRPHRPRGIDGDRATRGARPGRASSSRLVAGARPDPCARRFRWRVPDSPRPTARAFARTAAPGQ